MPDLNEQLSQFIARRKAIVAETIDKGGEQAEKLLKTYGAPSSLDAGVSGFQQGALHGFADDMERAERGDGVAKKHVMSRAARPIEYEVSALLGAMASVGGLRGAQALVGRAASAGARAGSRVSGAAGSAAIAAKHGERAKRIADKVATFGMKPNHRGTLMDAGHGALMGYGGTDVRADEEAFAPERFARAGMGAAASTVLAPLATSGAVAAANAPLALGGRRAFSQKMLEPPGVVTKGQAFWNKVLNKKGPKTANPTGRPREAIDISRSKDELAARGDVDIFTGQSRNPGIIARDTAPPMESTGRNVRQLADQAIAPVAPARIATLKGQERNMAAGAIEAQYPAPARPQVPATTSPQMSLPLATPASQADEFVGQMMEAFTRQDRPALESWVSTLEAAARKNPAIMPQVKASVARQLAINERADPGLNNTPVMRDFLNALGLYGNKAKGTPNILESARAPAREAFPTARYEDAMTRTQGQTPMRPRHAEAMRQEMDAYQPGPYTGPADPRQGPPTVARGDDAPHWLNPIDFFKDGKVNDAQVTASSALSGPLSFLAEDKGVSPLTEFMVGSPDHIKTPQAQQKPAAGMLADVPPGVPMPQDDPPLIPEQQAVTPQRADKDVIMGIQQAIIDAGFEVGGRDGRPDGVIGPLTQRAIEAFTMGATVDLEDVLTRIQNYPRGRLAQILAE